MGQHTACGQYCGSFEPIGICKRWIRAPLSYIDSIEAPWFSLLTFSCRYYFTCSKIRTGHPESVPELSPSLPATGYRLSPLCPSGPSVLFPGWGANLAASTGIVDPGTVLPTLFSHSWATCFHFCLAQTYLPMRGSSFNHDLDFVTVLISF